MNRDVVRVTRILPPLLAFILAACGAGARPFDEASCGTPYDLLEGGVSTPTEIELGSLANADHPVMVPEVTTTRAFWNGKKFALERR